ncbi:PEPxxWA-CTERM sorting domain-containing protein [Sphingomonas antarctica]|uniref:PEPxxWA-CTERM sorting domain-containing protein n=1 Tax=Sphingomonas antarctica TaxID=2040274 RepID=UPI0039E825F9
MYKVLSLIALGVATPAAAASQTVYDTSLYALNVGASPADPAYARTVDAGNGTVTYSTGARVSAPSAFDTWQQSDVGGLGVVGITKDFAHDGNGSLVFGGTNAGSKADLVYYLSSPELLDSFGGASYDWYRSSVSGTASYLVPSLRILLTNNGQFGSLIFEPIYQGTVVTDDQWTHSDYNFQSQVWNSNGKLTNPTGNYTNSLFDWAIANPNAVVVGFSTGSGSGWSNNFAGAVDNISWRFGEVNTSSFNFEVAGVPEPTQWALMIGGFGVVGAISRRRRRAVAAA